jgi:outer membrane protein TolC
MDKSPERRLSAADVATAKVAVGMAKTALLPTMGFTESATRGNDSVYAFSTKLRQQRFAQSDFDLNNLNRPTPIGDFTTRFAGNWTLFDSWRTQFQIRKANEQVASARSATNRAAQELVRRVVAAYLGVLFAATHVDVAQHQADTAGELLNASKSRVEAGTAVDSDQLSASANLAARQQELIEAEGQASISWAELERAVGQSIPDDQRTLPKLAEKHFGAPVLANAVTDAVAKRPDRDALAHERESQTLAVAAAKSAFGPTISAYGSWETNRSSFAGSGGNGWVAGAELKLDILPIARRQELAQAKIAQQRAAAALDSADNQIRLEVTQAWFAHQSAAKMLDVARASQSQSEESLRILRDRYEAGLATVTDLLRAEDAQRQSAASYWQAVYRNAVTWADLKFAIGTLTPDQVEDIQ